MTELFTVFRNHLFLTLIQIINDIENGKQYTSDNIIQRFYGNFSFHPCLEREIRNILTLFFNTDGPFVQCRFPGQIPSMLLTTAEKEWIRTMVEDEEVSFLLTPDCRASLLNDLLQTEALFPPECSGRQTERHPQGDFPLQDSVRSCIDTYQQALWQHKKIHCYQYNSTNTFCPFRLEYDVASKRFFYIVYDESCQQFHRLSARMITDITLLQEPVPDTLLQKFKVFLEQQKQSVTITIRKKWNAVKRCFLLFSSFDKAAIYNEDSDSYSLTVYYYKFDTPEVISKIISLGSAVTIQSPQVMRKKIINQLKTSYARYTENSIE
ncbi:WYL domain-containing protein [uncultured Megasphaera sp.]|jgi:predicted DNA-binding transcriptional regulator YafY|uniref:WYL domain-containing protein n=1 Tax=uncultured Megasphaera sp. TaxID=165188 RepID=UPI0025F1FAD6|nr:WYL domain-containing protein [uncultured Megasphaera sp.]